LKEVTKNQPQKCKHYHQTENCSGERSQTKNHSHYTLRCFHSTIMMVSLAWQTLSILFLSHTTTCWP